MLQAYNKRNPVFAFGWGREELNLVAASAKVKLAGYAEGLEIGEGWVGELADDCLQ